MIRRAVWRLAVPIRSFLLQHKRTGTVAQRVLDRIPALHEMLRGLAAGGPVKRYRAWIAAYDTLSDADISIIREQQSRASLPLLSIVVPVGKACPTALDALAQSLLAQIHARWELHVVGQPQIVENSPDSGTRLLFRDPRFRTRSECAVSLAEAWNHALRSAAGEFAVLVDPRFSLRPHSLFLLAQTIQRHPDAVLVYADEDEIDEEGARSGHYFKPDWNQTLFCSQNYLGGLIAFRRSLALTVGGCHDEHDGDCAWGLFLRMTAAAPPGTIHHLPFLLSHRRAPHPHERTARERVARAQEERLALVGRQATVDPVGESSYRTSYAVPGEPPLVSVIIPTTCRLEVLRPCLEGVLNRTSYDDLDVILVVNEIEKDVAERRDYLEAVAAEPQVRVLYHEDRPFNFSWVNNWAVTQAQGELICFLNDDTDVIGSGWLSAMVSHALQDRVAAVGAMLYFPNDRIQHAGVILGAGGLAGHNYAYRPKRTRGYHDRGVVDQDVSCVTAACMLVRRDVFSSVGGFDEALATAFNDVDLCLRLRKAGWRIVWTPSAELYHQESVSIGRHDVGEREGQWALDWNLIHSRWSAELMSDPYYSPNLSLDSLQLWEPAFPPRVSYPWRAKESSRRTTAFE